MEDVPLKRDFDTSNIGTKDFWDEVYRLELKNFVENKDIGEIWFGENCQRAVINWIKQCDRLNQQSAILDLGCGNGAILIELAKQGYTNLTGMDYSSNSIAFAKAIATEELATDIIFEVGDILHEDSCMAFKQKYQVCHDKGTYDAISLMHGDFEELTTSYIYMVKKILNDSGYFIITSCNWTKDQLLEQFKDDFLFKEIIPTTTIQFGGSSGSKYTTMVFMK